MAMTFDCRSWTYTTPLTTTGVVAMPSVNPAFASMPVDSTGTHQATPSFATLALLIGLVTSRVLARLAPGSVHPAATAGFADVLGALPVLAGAVPLPLLLLQPTARPAASRTALTAPVRLTEHLMSFISYVARQSVQTV